ncbi:hypothetical protein PPACK8108_LOCUS13275 [Phakopsora pachyrhizi]|uniref:Uncharacterized protein n=1 Tax=Phakopsora pachyrhizi TaxID=170000 RepID=A0AAV0B5B9_PHAPC|nr:hypothetical protein PPACK8108_LOCUS13275 [Phakopsora pachyrhizi]
MNSHLPYSPTTEDPIGIGSPPSLHSSLSPIFSTGNTSASGDWMPGHNGFTEATVCRSGKCEICQVRKKPCEFVYKKEISKGFKVWCNPELKAFGYEHPLTMEPTPGYPSDGSSIGEFLTSLSYVLLRPPADD